MAAPLGLTLVLGNRTYCSWSLRAWLALKQTKAAFQEIVVHLGEPDTAQAILRYSPSGRVPCLRVGDLAIWESLAIAEYLAERFPQAGLWPADRGARAIARTVACEIHADFAALRRLLPQNCRTTRKRPELDDAAKTDLARLWALVTDTRARFGQGGPYLFGSGFTVADAMLAGDLPMVRTYALDVPADAQGYVTAVLDRADVKEWYAAALAEPMLIPELE